MTPDHTRAAGSLPAGAPGLVLSGHTFWVSSVAAAAQGTVLASAAYDETVRVWDGPTGVADVVLTETSKTIPGQMGWQLMYCNVLAS